MLEKARLVTPRGSWTFSELAADKFGLVKRVSRRGYLKLTGMKSEEVVSAVLALDGQVPVISLGGGGEDPQPGDCDQTKWGFLSSGSTGQPKHVFHTLQAITRELPHRSRSEAKWTFLTDVTRMAGFQVVLEAVLRREDLVIPDREMALVEKVNFLVQNKVTHISATPSQFRHLLSLPASAAIPIRQITLGGEIADQKILDGLHAFFPKARITHVYATTETGPIFGVSDGLEGFPELQVEKKDSRVTISEDCEIGVLSKNGNQIFWTGDLVEKVNGRYHFVGRVSDIINVGGAKVFPASVEAVLLSHPDVQDCIVKGQNNPILGQLVVADLCLKRPSAEIFLELRQMCRALLPKYSVPHKFSIVDEIPRSSSGKKIRV